ncbi:MAG: SDR family NAD(P)-dependent oxidoreductase [Myxococcota bacterium]
MRILVTGATSGLGRATALQLGARNVEVIVGGRRREAVEDLVRAIESRGGQARPFVADLASLADIRRAVDDAELAPLDGIVANAGLTLSEEQRSADGYELTFAVNVLAHHLLVALLAKTLRRSGARVVFVSSGTQIPDHKLARRFGIPAPRWVGATNLAKPDEASEEERVDDLQQRYSTSKLGNVLQARAFQVAFARADIDADVFAIDPGLMVGTNLAREVPAVLRWIFKGVGTLATPLVKGMRRVETSATHLCELLLSEEWAGKGFAYLDGDELFPASDDGMNDDYRDALWRDAANLIRLQPNETALFL